MSRSTRLSLDDLVRKVADAQDMSLVATKAVLSDAFSIIKDTVASGNQVSVTKFGAFGSMKSKAYTARNPKTGTPVRVPAKDRVRFRAFESFKDKVEKS